MPGSNPTSASPDREDSAVNDNAGSTPANVVQAPPKRRRPTSKSAGKSRSGSDSRRMTRLVTIRYTEEEFAELDESASRAGITRPSYIRQQSLSKPKARSTRRPPIERHLLAKTLGQIGKVGSNLNQIAHAANMRPGQRVDIENLLAELRDKIVPAIMQALGRDA